MNKSLRNLTPFRQHILLLYKENQVSRIAHFCTIGFKWSWHTEAQFNTDLHYIWRQSIYQQNEWLDAVVAWN